MDDQQENRSVATALPLIEERVIVHCRGYQCLAFVDSDRRWHNAYSGEVLPDVKSWCSLNSNDFVPVG